MDIWWLRVTSGGFANLIFFIMIFPYISSKKFEENLVFFLNIDKGYDYV